MQIISFQSGRATPIAFPRFETLPDGVYVNVDNTGLRLSGSLFVKNSAKVIEVHSDGHTSGLASVENYSLRYVPVTSLVVTY